jgi:DNA (cytosine-5)-methyltransferase 1
MIVKNLLGTFEVKKDFASVDEGVETTHGPCPACGYAWSGSPNSQKPDRPVTKTVMLTVKTLLGLSKVEKTVPAELDYRCPRCRNEWTALPGRKVLRTTTRPGTVMKEGITEKPPYRVPSMREIEKIPWNGHTVVSTFSGCGGSCLGYRMAGFRVLWANEFVPAAQASYRKNHPKTILDCRDIKLVTARDIEKAVGMKGSDIDVFDGSPPCQAFSTAGKREKGWGTGRKYEGGTVQKNEDMFFEYVRILKGLQPRTFIAENVSGLVKGTAKGYFVDILSKLKGCGYRVAVKVLDAQHLGVPQMRQRAIFFGVREDLGIEPRFPKPLPYTYSVRDALPWILKHGHVGAKYGDRNAGEMRDAGEPCGTIGTSPSAGNGLHPASMVESLPGARAFYDSSGQFGRFDITDRPSPAVVSKPFLFVEKETDLSKRAIFKEYDSLLPGQKSRCKTTYSTRSAIDGPFRTIMSGIGGGGGQSSVVHPTERRKFSIAELKRICAFPDDFILDDTFFHNWERLGNAVPPVMMKHVALSVKSVLDEAKRRRR